MQSTRSGVIAILAGLGICCAAGFAVAGEPAAGQLYAGWATVDILNKNSYNEARWMPSKVPVELHLLRLGDMAIATNPFELFLDYGIQIKGRSKAVLTFLSQLTCDHHGYLPARRAVAGGDYSAVNHSNAHEITFTFRADGVGSRFRATNQPPGETWPENDSRPLAHRHTWGSYFVSVVTVGPLGGRMLVDKSVQAINSLWP